MHGHRVLVPAVRSSIHGGRRPGGQTGPMQVVRTGAERAWAGGRGSQAEADAARRQVAMSIIDDYDDEDEAEEVLAPAPPRKVPPASRPYDEPARPAWDRPRKPKRAQSRALGGVRHRRGRCDRRFPRDPWPPAARGRRDGGQRAAHRLSGRAITWARHRGDELGHDPRGESGSSSSPSPRGRSRACSSSSRRTSFTISSRGGRRPGRPFAIIVAGLLPLVAILLFAVSSGRVAAWAPSKYPEAAAAFTEYAQALEELHVCLNMPRPRHFANDHDARQAAALAKTGRVRGTPEANRHGEHGDWKKLRQNLGARMRMASTLILMDAQTAEILIPQSRAAMPRPPGQHRTRPDRVEPG